MINLDSFLNSPAPDFIGDERPDASSNNSQRYRRRGPRSLEALKRRSRSSFSLPFNSFSATPARSPHNDRANSPSSSSEGLCQSRPPPAILINQLSILQCNIRGWISHHDELEVILDLQSRPSLIFLNETLLNQSIENPGIAGYDLIGRYEEVATKRGIAVYASTDISSDVVLLLKSSSSERIWLLLHS